MLLVVHEPPLQVPPVVAPAEPEGLPEAGGEDAADAFDRAWVERMTEDRQTPQTKQERERETAQRTGRACLERAFSEGQTV